MTKREMLPEEFESSAPLNREEKRLLKKYDRSGYNDYMAELSGIGNFLSLGIGEELTMQSMERAERLAKSGIFPDLSGLYRMLGWYLYSRMCTDDDFEMKDCFINDVTDYLSARKRKGYEDYLSCVATPGRVRDAFCLHALNILIDDLVRKEDGARKFLRGFLKDFYPWIFKHAKKYSELTAHNLAVDLMAPLFVKDDSERSLDAREEEFVVFLAVCLVNGAIVRNDAWGILGITDEFWNELTEKKSKIDSFIEKMDETSRDLNDEKMTVLLDRLDEADPKYGDYASQTIFWLQYLNGYVGTPVAPPDYLDYEPDILSPLYKAKPYHTMRLSPEELLTCVRFGGFINRTLIDRADDISLTGKLMEVLADRQDENTPTVLLPKKKEEKKELPQEVRDDLLEEIDLLRKRLLREEAKTAQQRHLYEREKAVSDELSGLRSQWENDRAELLALRKFAYESTQTDDVPKDELSLKKMQDVIANKKITVIGGDANWTAKLRRIFPSWNFISPGISSTVPAETIVHSDMVFFFTSHICHSQYYRFIEIIRKNRIPLGYIARVNIEENIRQIYEDSREAGKASSDKDD